MMNALFFIVPFLVLAALLLGRYSLRIHVARSSLSSVISLNLRSVGEILGLDWQSDGTDSSMGVVLFKKALRFPRKDGKMEEQEATERGEVRTPHGRRSGLNADRLPVLLREGRAAAGKLLRVFHLETAGGIIRFGTGDPCSTGILYGFTQTLLSVRGVLFKINVIPDFTRSKLEGEAEATFRFTMARLAAVGIAVIIKIAPILRRS